MHSRVCMLICIANSEAQRRYDDCLNEVERHRAISN